jgi:15-cis-phytoene synthase
MTAADLTASGLTTTGMTAAGVAGADRTAAIAPRDLEACRAAIRVGSRSFHAASHLLPRRWRDPALALYAFCRFADDEVDCNAEKPAAVLSLADRLDRVYAGRPVNHHADRSFAAMVEAVALPRALPEALLEGFAWDAQARRYATLPELRAYAARVAAAVGAMMTVIIGTRDADTLARACDLGVAMQLTNVARDIGEDAREGRLYLPTEWFAELGVDPDRFLAAPAPSPELAEIARRLLAEADRLYRRAEAGITALPLAARPAIFAARLLYAEIGSVVRAQGHDAVSRRAVTTPARKARLAAASVARAASASLLPQSAVLHAPPLPETAFLVAAAARPAAAPARADHLTAIFAELRRRDAERMQSLRPRLSGLRSG